MTTVQDFLSNIEITGALTPEQAAQLLELPHQGDTVHTTETADTPVLAPAPTAEPNTTTSEPTAEDLSADNAVILAKDGKHQIPFDKLTEARESAQQAAAERDVALRRSADLQAQLDAAQRQPAATTTQQPAAVADLKTLRQEHFEAMQTGDAEKVMELGEKIDAENQRIAEDRVMQRLGAERAQEQANAAVTALQQAAANLKAKYPALDETGASANLEAIDFVIYKRDALIASGESAHKALEQAVEKAASLFNWSNGQKAAAQPNARAAEAAAAAAIAAAKAPTPATLSDIPGGKPGGLSLEAQMAAKSGPEQLDIMQSMSREQIEDYLNRTL